MTTKSKIWASIKKIKFFDKLLANKVLQDVLKFYFVYFMIFLFNVAIYGTFVKLSLDPFYDLKQSKHLDFDKTIDSLWQLISANKIIALAFAYFAVFFALPPKNLKHICIVGLLIFIINDILLYQGSFFETLLGLFTGSIFVLMPWSASLAWHRFQLKTK